MSEKVGHITKYDIETQIEGPDFLSTHNNDDTDTLGLDFLCLLSYSYFF